MGVPVAPIPTGNKRRDEIVAVRARLSQRERDEPRWDPDNAAAWTAYFEARHARQMAAMPPGSITPRNNADSRPIWWGEPGRTLDRVLEHIRGTFDEDGKRKEKKRCLRRASPIPLAVVRPDEEAPSSGRASLSNDLVVLSDSDDDDDDTTLAVVLYTGDAGQSSSNAPRN